MLRICCAGLLRRSTFLCARSRSMPEDAASLNLSLRQYSSSSSLLIDLSDKKALVTGIANDTSIAWGIAQQLHKAGADIAVSFLPDAKGRHEAKVRQVVAPISPALVVPLDVENDAIMTQSFTEVAQHWGKLDILVHSIAFATREDLAGRFIDTSRDSFDLAMNISTHSLLELSRRAFPLMEKAGGGSILTLSFIGSERAFRNYNVMGPCKAALEASVRYLANELGEKKIRVNALSPGPILTLAGSGIPGFRTLADEYARKTCLRRLVSQKEVGCTAAFLASDLASAITGQVLYVDAGFSAVG